MVQKAVMAGMLLVGLGLIGLAFYLDPPREAEQRPNVVFIVIDTLRADRVHAVRNGVAVMPELAALAREGAEFTHTVAPSSWTRPTMASLFTGVYVDTHQVYFSVEEEDPANPTSDLLGGDWQTLSEYLVGHGFDNFAFVTNANVAYPVGFGQGFAPQRYIFGNNARAEEVTTRTLKEVGALREPFFLYLHYMDPHAPYDPPKSVQGVFGGVPEIAPEDAPIFENFMDYYMECTYLMLGLREERTLPQLSPQGEERVWTLYDLECHYADMHVGRLVRELRKHHPDTLFVITSDHGEEFWERGGMGHGTTLYEEQITVPLVVAGPGIPAQRVEHTTELIGFAPTLAAYLKLPPLEIWQGHDWFSTKRNSGDPAFARTLSSWRRLQVDLEAVWMDGMKLVHDKAKSNVEVYDLRTDPGERNDLSEQRPEIAERGMNHLIKHREQNAKRRGADRVRVQEQMDPRLMDQLKGLGYFDDDLE